MELYKKYRPKELADIVGQKTACGMLATMIKRKAIPHTILFTGPSGVGKTTIARILMKKVGCGPADFRELNCADFRGIDEVRKLRDQIPLRPLTGKSRVWVIDECHRMTGEAQDAILKILEDTPEHCYFFLCTTDPEKLTKTIRTRCCTAKLNEIKEEEMEGLLNSILEGEDYDYDLHPKVMKEIIKNSEGSARQAVQFLEASMTETTVQRQMEVVQPIKAKQESIEICRALMNKSTDWPQMSMILRSVKSEPESIRWLVLAWCNTTLLRSGKPRAFRIIEAFRDNYFDSKAAGLSASCYEVLADEEDEED